MKRLNIWLDKFENKFKLILDKPISMSILLGFVLGATLTRIDEELENE